ncbi:hypothetical protein SLA2020_200990 [Shorea laevis]
MATQSFTSSPIPAKPTLPTITNRPVHLPVIYSRASSGRQKPSSSSVRATLSPAATTAVQPNEPTTYGKSSKTLPFRVGHGFDLHRLEPGYPLIIGGIDIPHDRGCEAHSDGMCCFTVLLMHYWALWGFLILGRYFLILIPSGKRLHLQFSSKKL